MTIDTWLAISAGATFLLALAAFWAIWQNYQTQKRERRERLLNEIIEWAIDTTKWRPKEIHKDIAGIRENAKQQELMAAYIGIIMDSLVEMRGRNQYTSSIAMKVDKTVKESVDKLIKEMDSYIALLYEWETIIMSATDKGTVVDDTEEFDKAEYKEDFIGELANEVIEEATKIKTRDIG